jgi:hypothetical protein
MGWGSHTRALYHMEVDHRGRDIGMAGEVLHGPDVAC